MWGYYALYMFDLAQQDLDKELWVRWENLKNSSKVWRDHATAEEFERGLLHPQLVRELSRKADDDLLKSMKDLEGARAELPKQAVNDYKDSAGFKEGLKRMGRVTYEYGYRVALARFRSSHPDSEVEEDPFTIRPKDDSVPIERQ
ncbi:hypothetical protein B296_00006038 [Ensete ventricosum]|uniref:Uncharacterized protein n=1 Tax=Ensete ventricosum TaxID=4639 RepID=A0A426ZKY9_ENSVE|nr:hypothetical protein B296_00006038 [Ensete ventricosum]